MRLSIEELIFLFEKKIAPTPERLKKGNEEAIRRLLYPSPIIIGNPLRNIMAFALCRDEVIGAVLSLIKKEKSFKMGGNSYERIVREITLCDEKVYPDAK